MICTSSGGQPQALQAHDQIARLGGGCQRIEAITPSVPLARMFQAPSRPGSDTLMPEHVDLRPGGHERQHQGEDHERDLDHHALEHELRPGPASAITRQQQGVDGEGPEGLPRGRDDHEQERTT